MTETSSKRGALTACHSVSGSLRAALESLQGIQECADAAANAFIDCDVGLALASIGSLESHAITALSRIQDAHDAAPMGCQVGWVLALNRLCVDLQVLVYTARGIRETPAPTSLALADAAEDLEQLSVNTRLMERVVRGALAEFEEPEPRQALVPGVPSSPAAHAAHTRRAVLADVEQELHAALQCIPSPGAVLSLSSEDDAALVELNVALGSAREAVEVARTKLRKLGEVADE